ncbi:hypothetical protein ACIMN3_24410, partial [Escherichia coli]|uniref:hypothetical protein n=2 Tax=Escherichia coli TaxID=562 RepID=UPI002023ADA9
TGIMKAFKFSFLLLSNEYFHVGQHDLLLLKNQASSMITGIYQFDIYEKSIDLSCEGLLFLLLNDINYHSHIKTIMAVRNIWQGCELNDQTF